MTIEDLIDEVRGALSSGVGSADDHLARVDRELANHPRNAQLWCLRGDLIQLGSGNAPGLHEAREAYERAASEDPSMVEAFESLGYFWDAIEDNPGRAEFYFRRGLELGGGASVYYGLARVLAQLGRPDEALELIASAPAEIGMVLAELKSEIQAGDWAPEE
jgi:tetratricopeptide (TPR) repeat protein